VSRSQYLVRRHLLCRPFHSCARKEAFVYTLFSTLPEVYRQTLR
jgi:hypothetical protein